jgi:hypothetical protein
MTEISVNHVQVNSVLLNNKKVAVGGKLQLDENRLDFVPTKWDEVTGGDKLSIQVEKIDTVGKKERYTGGVFDTLFAGDFVTGFEFNEQMGQRSCLLFPIWTK